MTQTQGIHKGINSDQLSITNPIWEVNTATMQASINNRAGAVNARLCEEARAAKAPDGQAINFNWDNTRFKSIGGRSQAVQDERAGNYSQIYSGLRPFDADIGVKTLKKWGLNGSLAGIPEASRFCARAGRRIRQIVQRKKWQCQRQMVIVRSLFESKSESVLKSSVFAPLGDAV